MSSATPSDPYAASRFINSDLGDQVGRQNTGSAFQLSERQRDLDRLWQYYRCKNYDSRKVDWNGSQVVDHFEHEVIATQGYTPPGFYDAGATFPVKFRRPLAPFYLTKVIVDRFTGLLFSEGRAPAISYEGDALTEDYMRTVVEVGRLWSTMMQARRYGGAMGSAAVSFALVNGQPRFEAHDPRWCIPKFKDRHNLVLKSLEKRYVFPDYFRDQSGTWVTAWFWYRRVITETTDIVWPRVPVVDGEEPEWEKWEAERVEHHLGICPAVWIQNTAETEDVDGDPDCWGAYDLIESHDMLMSQAQRGVMANCDPTLFITSDEELGSVSKGSENALKLEAGASAQYLEISGSGPEAATKLAETLRERAYELTACVPDDIADVSQTATEIRVRMARMIEKADAMREQYGEMGVKRLLEIAEYVIRKVTTVETMNIELDEDGNERAARVVGSVNIPPKYTKLEDGTAVPEDRVLGPGGTLRLVWPRYFEPTLDDINKAVAAARDSYQANITDLKTAVKFLKNYLPMEDEDEIIRKLEEKQAEELAAISAEMGGAVEAEDPATTGGGEEEAYDVEFDDEEMLGEGDPFSDDYVPPELEEEGMPALPAEGYAPPAMDGTPPPSDVDIQKQVLNGAQIGALVEVVEKAALGTIPRKSAVAIIVRSFFMSPEEAEEVLADIGLPGGFKAEKPEPKPFGAPPPGKKGAPPPFPPKKGGEGEEEGEEAEQGEDLPEEFEEEQA